VVIEVEIEEVAADRRVVADSEADLLVAVFLVAVFAAGRAVLAAFRLRICFVVLTRTVTA
jgi:hypothetical protein